MAEYSKGVTPWLNQQDASSTSPGAERAARGKAARRRSTVPSACCLAAVARPGPTRSPCWRAGARPGSRSWCRSDTAACSSRRSRSTAVPPTLMAADLARAANRAGRASAATRTVELRHLRGPGSAARVRHQRLRRDVARPVRVGRQTAGHRVSRSPVGTGGSTSPAAHRGQHGGGSALSRGDARHAPRCERSMSGTRASMSSHRRHRCDADEPGGAAVRRATSRRPSQGHLKALAKLGENVDGSRGSSATRRSSTPISDLLPLGGTHAQTAMHGLLRSYRPTLQGDRRHCRAVPPAPTSPGRSSAWAASARAPGSCSSLGSDDDDPVIPPGQGGAGVGLEPFLGKSEIRESRPAGGRRAAADAGRQRRDARLDSRSDGIDGVSRDFYVRQLWDGKGSAGSTSWNRTF